VQWEKNFPIRGWVHRIAGLILMGASVYHVIYMFTKRDGRRWFKAMLPRVRDVQEAVQTVGYNMGYRSKPPLYARFNYTEKAEYWALVWGTIVMAATGVLLWAHDWVLAYLPYPMSVLDVTTAVHFYEAILATFAILIWHFYFVIFDPDVYPIKWTALTGRAPHHEVREEEEEELVPVAAAGPQSSTADADRSPAAAPSTSSPSKEPTAKPPAKFPQPSSAPGTDATDPDGTTPGVKPSKPN
jgi:hypothetical protein